VPPTAATLAFVHALLAGASVPVPLVPPAAVAVVQPVPDADGSIPTDALTATLTDPRASPARIANAADTLLLRAERELIARGELERLLAAPEPAAAALLEAMGRRSRLDPALWPALEPLVRAPGPLRLRAISAAGALRIPAAADSLISALSDGAPEVASAAEAALVRLTGQDRLGSDAASWRLWVDAARPRWEAVLASSQAARADRLSRRLAGAEKALVDASRRLYLSSSPDDRPALLAAMLSDLLPAVRSLGFELADREASAGRDLSQAVGPTLLTLLADPSPAVRARAAQLVTRVAPDGAGDAVAAALQAESDPAVVGPLLLAAARWPSEATRVPVLRWLAAGPAPGVAACEATLAALRADLLTAPEDRLLAIDALRRVPARQLPAAGLRALATLLPVATLAELYPLLLDPDAGVRAVAGDALSARPEALDTLTDAAADDAALLPAAARAVAAFEPVAARVAVLASGPWPDQVVRRTALGAVLRELSPAELLSLADRLAALDPLREDVLAAAIPLRDDPSPERAECLVRLAELRLNDARPDGAVAALDALMPGEAEGPIQERAGRVRTISALILGSSEPTEDLAPDLWVDAYERCADLARADELEAMIREHVEPGMPEDLLARWRALTARREALRAVLTPPDADAVP
jgi:hypothetical protein